jgi:hypothetical protein
MSESVILHAVRAALLSDGRVMLWRNNTGADTVEAKHTMPRRFIRYGLGKGSADLVGLVRGSARFVTFEIKSEHGRVSREQQLWGTAVRAAGGFYAVVRSVEEALRALEEACS